MSAFFSSRATEANTPARGSSIAQAPQPACRTNAKAVSDAAAEAELDEGIDYFSAQGALEAHRLANNGDSK